MRGRESKKKIFNITMIPFLLWSFISMVFPFGVLAQPIDLNSQRSPLLDPIWYNLHYANANGSGTETGTQENSSIINLSPKLVNSMNQDLVAIPQDVKQQLKKYKYKLPDGVIGEFTKKRTENSKLFLKEDGRFVELISATALHYKDKNGDWQEIDNTIKQSNDGGFDFQNTANQYQSMFSKTTGNNKFIRFQLNEKWLDFIPINSNKTNAIISNNQVVYPNVYNGVDFIYQAENDQLKEDIVLNSYTGKNTFSFSLDLNKVGYKKNEDGSIEIFDLQSGASIYKMDKPFMTDAKGVRSDNVQMSISQENNRQILTITADPGWLTSSERAYPVYIDPTITINNNGIEDTYIGGGTVNHSSEKVLKAGWVNSTDWYKTLINFHVTSKIPQSSVVRSAKVTLFKTTPGPIENDPYLFMYQLTSSWNPNNVNTGNSPSEGTQYAPKERNNEWYSFDVSETVRSWFANSTEYGFSVFVDPLSNPAAKTTQFNSSRNSTNVPQIEIEFDSEYYAGYVSDMPTVMQAGKTIQVPVNVTNSGYGSWPNNSDGGLNPVHLSYHWKDANGNTVTFDGLRTEMPYIVYPGDAVRLMANIQAPATPGTYKLQLDMVQENVTWFSEKNVSMAEVNVTVVDQFSGLGIEKQWQYQTDSFNNKINLSNGNLVYQKEIIDLPGRMPINASLTYNSKSSFQGIFGYGWNSSIDQTLIEEANGNVKYIDSDGTEHIFTKNIDGTFQAPPGVYFNLKKDTSGTVPFYILTDQQTGNYSNYEMKGSYYKIVATFEKNSKVIRYIYGSSNRLESIKLDNDASSRVITISYDTNNHVSQIVAPGTNDANGQPILISTRFTVDSNGNLTSVIEADGTSNSRETKFDYNPSHQMISITSPNGNKAMYVYEDNRVVNVHGSNLVDNSGFDNPELNLDEWTVRTDGETSITQDNDAFSGSSSVKITRGVSQGIAELTSKEYGISSNNDYVLSFAGKSSESRDISGHKGILVKGYDNKGQLVLNKYVFVNQLSWTRYEMAFNSGSATKLVICGLMDGDAQGNMWLDAFQLEEKKDLQIPTTSEVNWFHLDTSVADWNNGSQQGVETNTTGGLNLVKAGSNFGKVETTQSDFATGTLSNVASTPGGTLELSSNNGVYQATGFRESDILDLSGVKNASASNLSWTANVPAGTGLVVETNLSLDGGLSWQGWNEIQNGGSISGITPDTDLSNARLKTKVTLTTTDTGITPQLEDVTIHISAGYLTSGTWTSPILNATAATGATHGLLNVLADLPSGSEVHAEYRLSTDGVNWENWRAIEGNSSFAYKGFIQYRVTMKASTDLQSSPELKGISIFYNDAMEPVMEEDLSGYNSPYSFVYDSVNGITKVTDPNGKVYQYAYNPNGCITSFTSDVNGEQITTNFVYDHKNNVIQKTDSNGEHHYIYDLYGNLVNEVLPSGGIISNAYDGNNNLIRSTEPFVYVENGLLEGNGESINSGLTMIDFPVNSDANVMFTSENPLFLSGNYTIETLISQSDSYGYGRAICSTSAVYQSGTSYKENLDSPLYIDPNGYLGVYMQNIYNNYSFISCGSYSLKNLSPGIHRLSLVVSGTTMKYFVDGNLIGTISSNFYGYLTVIGNMYGGIYKNGAGKLSDFRVWGIARSDQQIKSDMFNRLNGNEAGLLSYWKMNEKTGGGIFDSTPNQRTGYFNSTVKWEFENANFIRDTRALKSDNQWADYNEARFEQGVNGQAVFIEEGTVNKLGTEGYGTSTDWTTWSHWNVGTYWTSQSQTYDPVLGNVYSGVNTNANGTFLYDYYPYSVSKNTSYTISIMLKASQSWTGTIKPYINQGQDNAWLANGSLTQTITLDGNWKKFTFTITPTADALGGAGIGFYFVSFPLYATLYAAMPQFENKGKATSFTEGVRNSDTLLVPLTDVINPNEGTIEGRFYLKPVGNSSYRPVFSSGGPNSPGPRLMIMVNTLNNLKVWDGDGNTELQLSATSVLQPNTWYEFAYTWSPQGRKLYLNGILEGTDTRSVPVRVSGSGEIGSWSGNYLNGLIDELRISKKALSNSDILSEHQIGGPLSVDQDTSLYMNFDGTLANKAWNLENWTFTNEGTSNAKGTLDGANYHDGNQSFKVEKINSTSQAYYTQTVQAVKEKTYTLSAWVKTAGISNATNQGAHLFVRYKDANGDWIDGSNSAYVNGTNDWKKISFTFSIPVTALDGSLQVNMGITEESGQAWFDGIQLEAGSVPTFYNLSVNGSFEKYDYTCDWSLSAGSVFDGRPGNTYQGKAAIRISHDGKDQVKTVTSKKMPVKPDEVLSLSAFVKSINLVPDGYHHILIRFYDKDNKTIILQDGPEIPAGSYDWIRIAKTVKVPQNAAFMDICIAVKKLELSNTIKYRDFSNVWVDGIQLQYGSISTGYIVDSNNNVNEEENELGDAIFNKFDQYGNVIQKSIPIVSNNNLIDNSSFEIMNDKKDPVKWDLILPLPNGVSITTDASLESSNQNPSYRPGKFGQSILMEEGTTNLISNPSFETDTDGNRVADGWGTYKGSVTSNFDLVTSPVINGGKSQKVSATGLLSSGYCTHINQTIYNIPTPGSKVTLSAFLKVNSLSNAKVQLYTDWYDSTWRNLGSNIVDITSPNSELTRYSLTGTVPANASFVVVYLIVRATGANASGEFIADGIQLEGKPIATSLAIGSRANNIFTVPTSNVISPSQGTVETWVYVNSNIKNTATNRYIFALSGLTMYKNTIALSHTMSNTWSLWTTDSNGNNSYANVNDTLSEGWHLFSARWSSSETALFIDGEKAASCANPKLPSAVSDKLYIGLWASGDYGWVDTYIDDFRISSKARADSEILAGYRGNRPLPEDVYTTYKLNMDGNIVSNLSVAGKNTLKVNITNNVSVNDYGRISNPIAVAAGTTYTLSASIKGMDIKDGKGAFVKVQYFNGLNAQIGETEAIPFTGTFDWRRQTLSFKTPVEAVYVKVQLVLNGHGTAWFDADQLECGATASQYNLIENAGAEKGTLDLADSWVKGIYSGTNPEMYCTTLEARYGSKSLEITSDTPADARWYQDINVKPNTTYTFTGWVKTENIISTAEVFGTFFIGELSSPTSGYTNTYKNLGNHSGTTDWTRVIFTFTTTSNTQLVRIGCVLGNWGTATGTAWFDGMKLVEGEVMYKYEYDANGHFMTKQTDPLGRIKSFAYDTVGNLISEIDEKGYETKRTYDVYNRLLTVTDPLGNTITYTYDLEGNKTSETDGKGNKTQYIYDKFNRLVKTVYPDGSTQIINYDAVGNKARTIDGEGNSTFYRYNGANKMVAQINSLGNTTCYAYDSLGNLTTVTDPAGFVTTYEYDRLNRMVRSTDPNQHTVTLTYDQKNNVISKTDGDGNTTSFIYDDAGRLIKEIDPAGLVKTYTYDQLGNKVMETDPNGNVTYYQYDLGGRLINQYDTLGNKTSRGYDGNNNLVWETDASGNLTTYTYDKNNKLLTKVDPLGHIVEYTYDANGNQTTMKDVRGYLTSYEYDQRNRLTKVTDARNGVTRYTYDNNGNKTTITDPEGNITKYKYDPLNREIEITDGTNHVTYVAYQDNTRQKIVTDEDGHQTISTYDGLNRLIGVTDPCGGTVRYEYDGNGNRTKEIDARGNITTYQYDSQNHLKSVTDSANGVTVYEYDNNGNKISITDPKGNKTEYVYDALNRQIQTKDALDNLVTISYDVNGNKTGEKDALGNTTTYTYDALDRLTKVVNPLGGTILYGYDANGNKTSETDARGNTTLFTYDELNRLATQTDALGGITEYTRDNNGNILTVKDPFSGITVYVYDPLNRAIQMTDALGKTTSIVYDDVNHQKTVTDARNNRTLYAYDGLNRLVSITDPLGGITTYQYDAEGNKTLVIDPNGNQTLYEYDSLNHLMKETDALGNLTVYTYDANGNRKTVQDPRGNTTTYAYDGLNRLTDITDARNGVTSFTYDNNGNRVTVQDPKGNITTYTYDALNRLTSEQDALGYLIVYSYDANGNKLTVTDPVGNVTAYGYDVLNRVVQMIDPLNQITSIVYDDLHHKKTVTDAGGHQTISTYDGLNRLVQVTNPLAENTYYEFDANGNQTGVTDGKGKKTVYGYDELNRLISVTDPLNGVTSYTYSANGNRKTVTDALGHVTTYFYDSVNRLIQVTDALGNITKTEYDANDNKTLTTDGRGNQTSYVYDVLNRLTQITDALLGITRYTYDANGNKTGETDPNGNTTVFAYDGLNRLTSISDALNGVTSYTYDKNDNKLTMQDPLGKVTQYVYDKLNRVIRITDALNQKTEVVYDDIHHQKTVTDVYGNVTRYYYDAIDQLVKVIDPLNRETTYQYDANGNKIQMTEPGGDITTYTYDFVNRLETITDAMNGITRYTYDLNGNKLTVTNPLGQVTTYGYDAVNRLVQVTDALNGIAHYTYDQNGNKVTVTDPMGNVTTYSYDALNRLTSEKDALNHSTLYTYDANGNRKTVTDPLGNKTVYGYDALNRLVSVTDALGNVTQMAYDASGNKTSTTDPKNNTTTYGYDAIGRITSVKDPLNGTTQYTYDLLNNKVTVTDPRGNGTIYLYDPINRQIQVTDALGHITNIAYDDMLDTKTITDARGNRTVYTYDALDRLISITDPLNGITQYTYDANGNRTGNTDASGNTTAYAYDSLNRLLTVTNPLNGITRYTYDANGNKATETDPLGNVTHYTYDSLNRVIQVEDGAGKVTTLAYDANDNKTGMTDANGNTITYGYDEVNRLVTITDPLNGIIQYTYDANGNKATETDAVGNVTQYSYDKLNRLVQVTDALGYLKKATYDASGNLLTSTDANGNTTLYEYDALNRLVKVTDPLNKVTEYGYDQVGNKTTLKDANGFTTSYTYDAGNRLVTVTNPLNGVTRYTYDQNGNVQTVTDPMGNVTQYVYDKLNRLTQVTDALGYIKTTTYDANGNILTATDANNQTTTYVYDAVNRVIQVTDPLNGVTRYTYDGVGNKTALTDANGHTTSYTYNQVNRLIAVTNALNGGTQFTYDKNGNLLTVTDILNRTTVYTYDKLNRKTSVTTPLGETTTYTYDGNGNLLTETDANGHTITYGYDARNKLVQTTDPLGNVTSYTYDNNGNKVTVTDPLGNVTTNAYDSLNRLVSVTDPLGNQVSYEYDANGNITATVDAEGGRKTFAYDKLNRMISSTNPIGNTIGYQYDGNGNLIQYTDGVGNEITYTYDALNRLTQKAYPDSTRVTYTYDLVGNRLSMTDSQGTTAYEYDALNRLTKETKPDGKLNTYTYDGVGNVVEKILDGTTETFVYDANNRMTSASKNGVKAVDYTYDPAGNLVKLVYANGVTMTYTYDGADNILGVKAVDSLGTLVSDFTYTYDAAGRRTSETDGTTGAITTYVYDAAGRLVQVVDASGTTTYEHDGNGNVTRKIAPGGTTTYEYNLANQLIRMTEPNGTVTTYTYDANGNLTKESTGLLSYTQYTYNYEGKLTKVNTFLTTVAQYTYDGDGRRISKTVGGITTEFYYDNAQIAKEMDALGMTQAEYLYGYFGTPVSMTRDGQTYYYIYNAHGDTVGLTDALGATVMTYRYDAWGNVTATGSIKNPFQYVGQYGVYHDEETGLYLMQIRYYNSNTGRFITPDTFPGLLEKPISQNAYLYANGDPINHVDPDGHFSWGGLWKSVKSTVSKAASKVASAVKSVAKKAVKAVKKVAKKVTKAAKKVVKKAKQVAKKVVKKAKQAVKKVATKAAQKVVKAAKVVAKVMQTAKEGWDFVKSAARRAKEEAKKAVKDAIDKTVQVAKEGAAAVGEFMESKTGKMVMSGLQVVGGALQVAAGAALMSTGVGSVLGALVIAHGVNSMISGAADGYYTATNQNEKIGTVNPLRDYVYKPVLGKELGEKAFNVADFALGFAGGGAKNVATAASHVDDLAKGLGKVLDDIPTSAITANAGRNLAENGVKSAGRVADTTEDVTKVATRAETAAETGSKYAGKSSTISREVDKGIDYGKQAATSPANNKVTDLSEYRAKRAETKAVDEDLNFGKSANNDVQSMDMAEKMGSKSSNVVSMDVQAKAPIRGMEDSIQLKKVSGGEDLDYDAIGLPKQKQLDLVVNNEFGSSMKGGSEFTANAGRTDTAVDGIPSASGASGGLKMDLQFFASKKIDSEMATTFAGNATPSPALKNSPYHPDVVADRTKPSYVANPAHDKSNPAMFNPKKTPEPSDAIEVYNNSVRGGMGTWYGTNQGGKIYQYFSDNAGGVHFAGEINKEKLPNDVRKLLGIKY